MSTEILNDAEFYKSCEIIEGEKFLAPSANMGHNNIVGKLMLTIGMHVAVNKLGYVFTDNMDVHLPDGNRLRPDFVFVSAANGNIVVDKKHETLHGVPDMVAEIFSYSTRRKDIGIKKDIYERNGVKEYWMIDPWRESVDVYLLRDGKYFLDEVYQNCSAEEFAKLDDDDKAAIKSDVPVAVLDGFTIKIKNIFGWFLE